MKVVANAEVILRVTRLATRWIIHQTRVAAHPTFRTPRCAVPAELNPRLRG